MFTTYQEEPHLRETGISFHGMSVSRLKFAYDADGLDDELKLEIFVTCHVVF